MRLGTPRSTNARSLTQAGAAIALLAAVEVVLLVDGPGEPTWIVVLFPAVACAYLAAGVLAGLRRPHNRTGGLLVAGALAWLVASLGNVEPPALVVVGVVCATLPLAVVVHLLHGFPSGRLRGRFSHATVAAGYFVTLVLQAPLYLFAPSGLPGEPLMVADSPGLAEAGHWVQDVAGTLVMVATSVLLHRRLRAASPAQRRVLGPLAAYGIVAVVFVVLAAQLADRVLTGYQEERVVVQLALMAGVPLAFAAGVLRGGFARMRDVEELGAWLGADKGGRPTLSAALAETLGDRSLELVLWVPEAGGYVDFAGAPVTLPSGDVERPVVEIRRDGRRIGAIAYDATLIADRSLVEAAARMTAVALDHERLAVELTASRDQVRRSAARVVEAADDERRRIARDLHDGLQARLVVLAIGANGLATDRELPDAARARATGLRTGIEAVVDELRTLVQGVMPAALIERGLSAATEDLADRMPLPTEVDVDRALGHAGAKLPPAIELAGYFVVAEALANAVKHAQAHELRIHLARPDGHLRIEVSDDGVGGAAAGAGTGMRGMADRIDVLGGRLTVTSPPGGGTRIVAELPCAS